MHLVGVARISAPRDAIPDVLGPGQKPAMRGRKIRTARQNRRVRAQAMRQGSEHDPIFVSFDRDLAVHWPDLRTEATEQGRQPRSRHNDSPYGSHLANCSSPPKSWPPSIRVTIVANGCRPHQANSQGLRPNSKKLAAICGSCASAAAISACPSEVRPSLNWASPLPYRDRAVAPAMPKARL